MPLIRKTSMSTDLLGDSEWREMTRNEVLYDVKKVALQGPNASPQFMLTIGRSFMFVRVGRVPSLSTFSGFNVYHQDAGELPSLFCFVFLFVSEYRPEVEEGEAEEERKGQQKGQEGQGRESRWNPQWGTKLAMLGMF